MRHGRLHVTQELESVTLDLNPEFALRGLWCDLG